MLPARQDKKKLGVGLIFYVAVTSSVRINYPIAPPCINHYSRTSILSEIGNKRKLVIIIIKRLHC